MLTFTSFSNPYFPSFWWCNTWLDEIGQMTGRILWANVEAAYPAAMPGTFKRDLPFWAWFFDIVRPLRMEIADRIINAQQDMPARIKQVRDHWPALIAHVNTPWACP